MGSYVRKKWLRTFPNSPFLSLAVLTFFAGLAGCRDSSLTHRTEVQAQVSQAGVLDLGRVWRVEEGYYDEPHWVGVWTRRGKTNVFDATWKHCWMNETTQDVVEVKFAKDGQIVVFREGVKQYYRGSYSGQNPNKLRGRADWYGPDLVWTAEIEF